MNDAGQYRGGGQLPAFAEQGSGLHQDDDERGGEYGGGSEDYAVAQATLLCSGTVQCTLGLLKTVD